MLDANLADRKVVQYVMNRFGIHAKHRLGQNFLIRPDVVAAIAEAAELSDGTPVMEIGAGIGTLTQALAETGADVTAFELDQSLKRVLHADPSDTHSVRASHFSLRIHDAEGSGRPHPGCARIEGLRRFDTCGTV